MIHINDFEVLADFLKRNYGIHEDFYVTLCNSTLNNYDDVKQFYIPHFEQLKEWYYDFSANREQLCDKYHLINEEWFVIFYCLEFLYNSTKIELDK